MKVLINETGLISGRQTIVYDPATDKHFSVNSVSHKIANKTFILSCNKNGKVTDWNEVFCVVPSNHDVIIEMLITGALTTANFNFMED